MGGMRRLEVPVGKVGGRMELLEISTCLVVVGNDDHIFHTIGLIL